MNLHVTTRPFWVYSTTKLDVTHDKLGLLHADDLTLVSTVTGLDDAGNMMRMIVTHFGVGWTYPDVLARCTKQL